MSSIQLITGDVLKCDGLGADVMLTDPPYRAHVHAKAVSQSKNRGARKRDLGFGHLTPELRRHIAALAAKMRRWTVIYTDVESINTWRISMQAAGAKYIRPLTWVRWSMPQLSGDRPPSGVEMLLLFWGTKKGRKNWSGPGNLTHLAHKCLRGEGKNKAEKPLDQALDLVSWFSDPGECVLDATAGRGTLGVACKLLGRDYIGFEIDPEEAGKARARILAPALSKSDEERYRRWSVDQEKQAANKARLAEHTAKVRARLEKNPVELPAAQPEPEPEPEVPADFSLKEYGL